MILLCLVVIGVVAWRMLSPKATRYTMDLLVTSVVVFVALLGGISAVLPFVSYENYNKTYEEALQESARCSNLFSLVKKTTGAERDNYLMRFGACSGKANTMWEETYRHEAFCWSQRLWWPPLDCE